jgi:predicted nucleotide-binding protein (sugar kinase/HSP70/actin superfamily)
MRSSIDFESQGIRVFSPILHFQWGREHLEQELIQHAPTLQTTKTEIRRALKQAHIAQENFYRTLEERGREIIENLDPETPSVAIIARPYNGCDPGMNLDLSRKFRSPGVLPIPMDMLPLRSLRLPQRWRKVYWRYGQRIMKSAAFLRQNPNLFAVYVTNFSCGPDSFLLDFFRQEMAGKPYLQLEIDEHSADAGLLTRCEAFLDTLRNLAQERRKTDSVAEEEPRVYSNHRRLYIPCMSPHAHALAGAFRSMGVEAVTMEPSDEKSLELGRRHTSGRECYPCLLTTGDMVRQTQRPDFNPSRSAFFMASTDAPCRFGQYHQLHRHVLDKLGFEEVPILSLEQGNEWIETTSRIGRNFERHAWQAVVCVDVLEKMLLKTRPYETHPGDCDTLFQESVLAVSEAIAHGSDSLWETMKKLAERWKTSSDGGKNRSVPASASWEKCMCAPTNTQTTASCGTSSSWAPRS